MSENWFRAVLAGLALGVSAGAAWADTYIQEFTVGENSSVYLATQWPGFTVPGIPGEIFNFNMPTASFTGTYSLELNGDLVGDFVYLSRLGVHSVDIVQSGEIVFDVMGNQGSNLATVTMENVAVKFDPAAEIGTHGEEPKNQFGFESGGSFLQYWRNTQNVLDLTGTITISYHPMLFQDDLVLDLSDLVFGRSFFPTWMDRQDGGVEERSQSGSLFFGGETTLVDPETGFEATVDFFFDTGFADANTAFIAPDPDPDLYFTNAMALGPNWRYVEGFGNLYIPYFRWAYHEALGWGYYLGPGGDTFFIWIPGIGWTWTRIPDVYPYFFDMNMWKWWYFDEESSDSETRWFYDFGQEEWKSFPSE